MTDFSDYIVYADESGDHGLVSIDPEYPVFALTFCIIRKENYIDVVDPALQRFKFDFWGHDAVVLHEHEIRKEKGDFAFLMTDRKLRHLVTTHPIPNLAEPEPDRMPTFRHSAPVRHSRECGNPVDKIPYKELIYRLDSRIRGNDGGGRNRYACKPM